MPPGRKKGRKSSAPKRVLQSNDDLEAGDVDVWPTDPKELANYIDGRTMAEFFETPGMPVSFYEEVARATKATNLAPDEKICFSCPACKDKEYTTKTGLFIHMQKVCQAVPERVFTCLVCKEIFNSQDSVMGHIKQIHVFKPLFGDQESETNTNNNKGRRAARLGRMKVQLYETSSSYAEEFEVPEKMEIVTPVKKEKKNDKDSDYEKEEVIVSLEEEIITEEEVVLTPKKSGKPETECAWQTYSTINKPLSNAFQWTYDHKSNLEKDNPVAHTQWQTDLSAAQTVPLQHVLEDYLIINESPSFKIEAGSLDNIAQNKALPKLKKNFNDKDFKTLQTFTALPYELGKGVMIYTGGPVWSLAWCPYPLSVDNKDQYLASVSHFGEHILHPNRTYEDSIIVQFWNCGKLKSKPVTRDLKKAPKFAFGLAFDVGPVWDLKWCPVGGYIPKSRDNKERLGLIAMACAIGDVYILSLPVHENENGDIYRVLPTAILTQPSKGRHSFGQCMCVSWSMEDGANQIVAGFASGHITLWDLKTTSKFLLSKDGNGVTNILPFHSFRGHSKPVRGIDWCPFDSNLFCSGGMDRFLKVWDSRKTEFDLREAMSNKLSCIFEVNWPLSYAGVYVATGNTFSIQYHYGALFIHAGPATAPLQHITPNKSTCWSLSGNDWLNVVASGDVAGSVVLMACNNWNRQSNHHKKIPRVLLYQCEAIWEETDESDENEENAGKKENGGGKDKKMECETSSPNNPNPQYKLVFHDYTVEGNLSNWEKTEAHKRVRVYDNFPDEDLRTPVQAIHKVRWNPNMSYTWVATATHSGLIRLHCASGLISKKVDDISKLLMK